MYVNVHVKVFDHEKLIELFRSALVKEFHPKTGILFENEELKLKLFFEEEPAQESIYAFCECGNIIYLEYNYLEDTTNQQNANQEPIKNQENCNHSDQEHNPKTDKASTPEHSSSGTGKAAASTTQKRKYTPQDRVKEIPELNQISKESNSRSEFLTNIITFLEIPQKLQDVFLQIIEIYPKLSKPTWENIIVHLEKRNIEFNYSNRRTLCDAVTKKLNIRFINAIATINHILSEHETPDRKKSNPSNEENTPMFKCMPKLVESPHKENVLIIEKMLSSIDSELPFNEKIANATIILASKCMPTGISEEEIEKLLDFTLQAIEKLDSEITPLKPETITPDKLLQNLIRMQILTWSTIANQLAKFYNPDFEGRIQSIDLLTDIKEIFK